MRRRRPRPAAPAGRRPSGPRRGPRRRPARSHRPGPPGPPATARTGPVARPHRPRTDRPAADRPAGGDGASIGAAPSLPDPAGDGGSSTLPPELLELPDWYTAPLPHQGGGGGGTGAPGPNGRGDGGPASTAWPGQAGAGL